MQKLLKCLQRSSQKNWTRQKWKIEMFILSASLLHVIRRTTIYIYIYDTRRYNAPKANEVAITFENANGEPP